MRRGAIGILLLLSALLLPHSSAENCPPNALHCQLFVEVGQSVTVVAEFGMSITTGSAAPAAIFAAPPDASVAIWANVYVDASAGGGSATVDIEFNETVGVTFPNGAEESVVATTTPQNLTFPVELDDDFATGDVAFIPVTVMHEDGSAASTHIPLQVGLVEGTGTSLWDWWWLFALVLLVGVAVGALVSRVF